MKRYYLAVVGMLACAGMAVAGINIPGDGSDGGLHVTSNTKIDLSQAVTGNWDDDNSGNGGVGIYDSNKWAVVFKYTNVTINAGKTLTFNNHPRRAAVVWLVSGDVTINGTVSLDGESGPQGTDLLPVHTEPGPGGFRGGLGFRGALTGGPGFGPGGGNYSQDATWHGNASLLPLIGGSGGGGEQTGTWSRYGGAGGGAILIACTGTLTIDGAVRSCGGRGDNSAGSGAGGAVRLIAETILGSGVVNTAGQGGNGKIRIERVSGTENMIVTPSPSLVALDPGAVPQIWLPDDGPTVRIVSIGGESVSGDPRAEFGLEDTDIQIVESSTTPVVVETRNVEQASQVKIRVAPRINASMTIVNASVQEVVSADPLVIRWLANVPVRLGHSVVQVRVIRP